MRYARLRFVYQWWKYPSGKLFISFITFALNLTLNGACKSLSILLLPKPSIHSVEHSPATHRNTKYKSVYKMCTKKGKWKIHYKRDRCLKSRTLIVICLLSVLSFDINCVLLDFKSSETYKIDVQILSSTHQGIQQQNVYNQKPCHLYFHFAFIPMFMSSPTI